MSKIGNSWKIIQLLNLCGKMTAKELAERIEVSERMIRKYIKDFEQAGIYIESISGRYGGYVLSKKKCFLLDIL